MIALCPGSFDPPTMGHIDIIARAAALFDSVVVAVGHNPDKSGLFSPVERTAMLRELTADFGNCTVISFTGLLVEACREHGAGVVVKGVRSGADLYGEQAMAQMNRTMTGLETVLLPTDPQWSFVSSSLVKQVTLGGGDASALVPALVWRKLRQVAGVAPGSQD